jgi:Rifampin ADP-ribosyl transferase
VPDDFEPPPPATLDEHGHVTGPFLHGTRTSFAPGDLLLSGNPSHFRPDRPLAQVYSTTRRETAAWGAELAAALAPDATSPPRARVYEVEPTRTVRGRPERHRQEVPGEPHALVPVPRPAPRRCRGHRLAQALAGGARGDAHGSIPAPRQGPGRRLRLARA